MKRKKREAKIMTRWIRYGIVVVEMTLLFVSVVLKKWAKAKRKTKEAHDALIR